MAVSILAKAPVAGLAKTRLSPHLGAEGAARLQHWLIRRTIGTVFAAGLGPVTLWCAPDAEHPDLRACAELGPLRFATQPVADLGARMLAAVSPQPALGGTLIVGTDCPALDAGTLRTAATCLRDGDDAVVIPAEDGGYVLIGLRRPEPSLFAGIAWSTAQVMDATRDRLRRAGMRWTELPTLWDVDGAEDFQRLMASTPEVGAFRP